MQDFTAEYHKYGQYGTGICCANSIEELIKILISRGYKFGQDEMQKILEWENTTQKKYYGMSLTIRRGELEMTEYTSL